MPEMSRADWRVGVRVDLGAKACEIGSAAERDEHFAGSDRVAAEQFRRRAIKSGRTLRSNHGDSERDRDRGGERGDHHGARRAAPAFHERALYRQSRRENKSTREKL